MRIKKTSGTTPIQAQVLNANSVSEVDTYSCNYLNSFNDYSTDENVIGTWLGDTLYRKVVTGNMTEGTVAHNISNLKEVKQIYGVMHNTNTGKFFQLPSVRPSYDGYEVGLYADSTNITLERAGNVQVNYMLFEIVIEYTKNEE